MRFQIILITLIFASYLYLCSSIRLNPFENNDKLQYISNQFIAEWQWESWPMKQNYSEKDTISPGPRVNAALWKDNNGVNWYLFGGQPINPDSEKTYSDIWKYSVVTRSWERVFPFKFSQKNKDKYTGKIGGMVSLRVNFFDDNGGKRSFKQESNNNIILCGRSAKKNTTKTKKTVWNNFSRRKTDDSKMIINESKSLAVYGPRTSKSNTVWQIDLKDKLWTGYVCCCDTSNYKKINPPDGLLDPSDRFDHDFNKSISISTKLKTSKNVPKNQTDINIKIDRTEDEIDSEQEHMAINSPKSKNKKINQIKKIGDLKYEVDNMKSTKSDSHSVTNQNYSAAKMHLELNYSNHSKRINISEALKNFSTETVLISKNQSDITSIFKSNGRGLKKARELKNFFLENKTDSFEKLKESDNRKNATEEEKTSPKLVSKYCPDFTEEEEPVSWCDGNNDALITADLSSSQIILWFFNLKTSHWSQQLVEVAGDTQWPGCSSSTPLRYAGAGEEVYILCSMLGGENHLTHDNWNLTELLKNSSEGENSIKLVYRISSKRHILESLGTVNLENFYKQPDHQEMWRNESKMIMEITRIANNEVIMMLAYRDFVDLWILVKNKGFGLHFEPMGNVWRGSAMKRFTKYNAANYNFHFVSEDNISETVLILNPRFIPYNEYWPRERGRFIIRILKNENFKNQSLENRAQESNSSYDLLQSDLNLPVSDEMFSHSYNVKAVIFFGISLAIFTVFGVIVFLKKCVNCPSRILTNTECPKSQPVVRYSVMHDDLLYPVA